MHMVPSSIFSPLLIGLYWPMLAITTIGWPNIQPIYHRSPSLNPPHPTMPHPDQGVLGPDHAHYASQATSLPSAFSAMKLQTRLGTWIHDFLTRHILIRCDNSGDLYPVIKPSTIPTAFLSTSTSSGTNVSIIQLPFHSLDSIVDHFFDIIHSDLWTSPIVSSSGFKYYVLLLDHFLCPLRSKYDMFDKFLHFSSSLVLLQQIIDFLHNEFDMTNLGALNYFLGISATRTPTGLFLSKNKYALQLLERAHMVNCNPSRTPVDIEPKQDLSYVVQQICLYMHDPREPYFAALKLILRYVAHPHAGLLQVIVFYWVIIFCLAWLRNLLRELHSPLSTVTLVYCDNVSSVYMSANLVQHQRTKHTKIDIHFVLDMVTAGQVRVLHVPSHY
ncbi:ribonuclease H-like domain-containing protein [Tanacetum coccineum]